MVIGSNPQPSSVKLDWLRRRVLGNLKRTVFKDPFDTVKHLRPRLRRLSRPIVKKDFKLYAFPRVQPSGHGYPDFAAIIQNRLHTDTSHDFPKLYNSNP